ncbi:coiled-coil-helix-coiled-coil-helix domain-containing protein 2-like [Periplaneta americana]|uniref:coiled-coil-helix-coiled-coil-helix domain-containing protein 2-like n=1 Tax=Periplaneta americana TaxID=6978 RepID=UPI0037E8CDC6
MPRRGRGHSKPRSPTVQKRSSSTYTPHTSPSRPAQSRAALPPSPPQTQKQQQQQQQEKPGVFEQTAATAAGVVVGTAVGHAIGSVGHAIGSVLMGESNVEAASRQDEDGPCINESRELLQCSEKHSDFRICESFYRALRNCKLERHQNIQGLEQRPAEQRLD